MIQLNIKVNSKQRHVVIVCQGYIIEVRQYRVKSRPSMHSFNLPFITQGGIFWNFPIEIQWLKFIILLLLSQYQLLHFCTSESLIDPLSYIKRWSRFHKCRSKEVQIVYTLLQVNLLHVPRFPTQPASYMGG